MAFISAAYSSATVPPSFTNFGRAELFLIGSILESEEESDVISWKWGKGFFTKLFRSDKHKLQGCLLNKKGHAPDDRQWFLMLRVPLDVG